MRVDCPFRRSCWLWSDPTPTPALQGPALAYFTGSAEFNIAVKHWARKRCEERVKPYAPEANGFRVSEVSVEPVRQQVRQRWEDAQTVCGGEKYRELDSIESEEQLFDILGIAFVPPHMREMDVADGPGTDVGPRGLPLAEGSSIDGLSHSE